jgi:hypothetical protein
MSLPAPDWVSFDAKKSNGQDLLGLRASVQSISNELFNGVTTVTPKLRYLSVITWIIWRYYEAGLPDNRSSFTEFAAAQEAMVVMANRFADRSATNLVGVTGADEALDSGKNRLPLRQFTQNIAFNAYVASSRQLGLTHAVGSGLSRLSEERGAPLAKEFDKLIRASAYGPRLAKRPRIDSISRADLEELSATLSLEKIPTGERNILIDVLMPQAPVNSGETSRLQNYALLLWLSREKKAFVDEGDLFRAAQEPPQNLPACFASSADGWLGYIVRDLLAVCHEAVFGAVMEQVDRMSQARQSPALSAQVVAALMGEVSEKDEALRQSRLLRPGESVSTLAFRTLYERVRRRCRNQETVSNGLRRWSGGLSETDVYGLAVKSKDAALALLPVAWCLALHRVVSTPVASPLQKKLLEAGSIFQIGIEAVIGPKIEEFLQDDKSLMEVMIELTERSVQQHLRIAWKRFSVPGGKDVSVLVADTEMWSRNNTFQAGRTNSRTWYALEWLYQLRLTDENGLTPKGDQTLKRSLHILGKK